MSEPLHAGLIALRRDGRWLGVLIEGPSGIGKSDLALRALEAGFRLVADDRVILWGSGGQCFGRAPDTLSGLIEARGVGILAAEALPFCRIGLVVRCVAPDEVERLPEPMIVERAGVPLPALSLWPLEPTAPAKIRRAADHLGGGR
jgi:serine kinase of HPr protein (carbohydrate metabolism regulator)